MWDMWCSLWCSTGFKGLILWSDIKPLPVVVEGHRGTRGACQPHLSIGCISNALNFCQSGHSPRKHLRMSGGMVVRKRSRQKLHSGLFWFSGSAVLGRLGQCLGSFPRVRNTESLCPVLLPVSCQTGIAWVLALASWITWKFSLQVFSYFFGIAFKIFFLCKAPLAASPWSEMEILGKVTLSGDGNAACLPVLLERC